MATLITCAMFATATGIVGAVVTLMGLLAFPAMLRRLRRQALRRRHLRGRLPRDLIPPSILSSSMPRPLAFLRSRLRRRIRPGFLLAGLYVLYVVTRAMINPALCPKLPKEQTDVPFGEVMWALATSFFPLAMLIVAVLGAILFGPRPRRKPPAPARPRAWSWPPPTGAQFHHAQGLGLPDRAGHGDGLLPVRRLVDVLGGLCRAGRTTGRRKLFLSLNLSTTGFLLLTQIIIFLLGWPLEWTEIIIIFVPIFLPLLDDFKVDPIFFGILVALNTQTAFNTPPVAMAAFYLKGVAPPRQADRHIQRRVAVRVHGVCHHGPGLYFPGLALWLPDYLYRPR